MYTMHGWNLATGKDMTVLEESHKTEDEAVERAREIVNKERSYDEIHVQENGLLTVFQIYRGPSGLVTEYPVNR